MIFELDPTEESLGLDTSQSTETCVVNSDDVFRALKGQFNQQRMSMRDMRFRLVFFRDPIGVVRFSHLYKDEIIQLISGVEVDGRAARTVRTSGTLKTLKVWLKEKRGVVMPGKIRGHGKTKNMIEGKGG